MGIYLATSDLLYIGKGYQNDFRSATSRTRVDQGGPGAGRGGHRLCTDGSGEMAGPRTGVVYHVDQGLLATSNGNRTTISFLLMLTKMILMEGEKGRCMWEWGRMKL
jgi:hypothetical protein